MAKEPRPDSFLYKCLDTGQTDEELKKELKTYKIVIQEEYFKNRKYTPDHVFEIDREELRQQAPVPIYVKRKREKKHKHKKDKHKHHKKDKHKKTANYWDYMQNATKRFKTGHVIDTEEMLLIKKEEPVWIFKSKSSFYIQ